MRLRRRRWRRLRLCSTGSESCRIWRSCRCRRGFRNWCWKRRLRGVPEKGCAAAAVLSAGERGADLLTVMEGEWQPQTKRVYEQLRRLVPGRDRKGVGDDALLQAVLAAFPDRVARHRRDGEVLLSTGGSARMPGCRYEFLIAVDVQERKVHMAAGPIQADWLLDGVTESTSLAWNRTAERVELVTALVYDQLTIDETRVPAPPSEESARLLAEKALEVDIGRFADREALEQLRARAAFAGVEITVEDALRELCRGRTSFAELEVGAFAGGAAAGSHRTNCSGAAAAAGWA